MAAPTGLQKTILFLVGATIGRPTSAHEPKYNLMQGRTQKDYVIVGECLGAPSCKRKNLVNTKCLCSVAVILVIFSRLGSAGAHSAPLRVCIKPMPPLTPQSGFRGGGIGAGLLSNYNSLRHR